MVNKPSMELFVVSVLYLPLGLLSSNLQGEFVLPTLFRKELVNVMILSCTPPKGQVYQNLTGHTLQCLDSS